MKWSDYWGRLQNLRERYEKGELSTRQYLRKTKRLRRQYRRSEQVQEHGFYKHTMSEDRPIDTRAIEIEKQQINVGAVQNDNP